MNTLAEVPTEEKVEVERLKQRGDVKTALEQAGAQKESALPMAETRDKFNVAYESDLEFLAKTMQEVAEQELGEAMMERIRVYRRLLAQTPVDELEVRARPSVLFRVSNNTWLEAIVRYLVHPKEGGRVKTRLIKELLAKLTGAPDRVLFPKSNLR